MLNPTRAEPPIVQVRDLIRTFGGIMLIEQDIAVRGLRQAITLMNFGKLLAEPTPEHVGTDQAVIEAYLGSADHAA